MKDESNFFEFLAIFPNEAACIAFLEQVKWQGTPVSPFTGGEAYRISTRPGIYTCKQTRKNFTVRDGTIFAESRLPLHKWFFAIFLLHSLKKGISSVQIAKYLGITQKSAWFMLHRIRYAVEHETFAQPLEGIVEVDETYIGGKKPGKRGRGADGKTPVLGMIQRGGKVICEPVPNVKFKTVNPIISANVAPKVKLMTDEFSIYPGVARKGKHTHQVVKHAQKEYVRGEVHTNSIEGFWSHLKRGIRGIYISVSRKHLRKYCKEYEFRFNHRDVDDITRFNTWFGHCFGRLTYARLIGKVPA